MIKNTNNANDALLLCCDIMNADFDTTAPCWCGELSWSSEMTVRH